MIEIGDREFNTKKAAEEHIREILYRYPLNHPLEGDDLIFICHLLGLHPDADSKIGVGVRSIIIESEEEFNKTRHFSVVRTDETIEDFSFNKCLSPNLNEPIKLFRACARRAVSSQIISFKNKAFLENENIQCKLTGVMVDRNNSHVDHIPPNTFDKIILDFISDNNIEVGDVKFFDAPNGIGKIFASEDLKNGFAEYHAMKAQLRVVSPVANLRQKKK